MTRYQTPLTLQKKSGAFTLVEVLVVVGIVCLLAAILLPVFNRVRTLGRRTTCASNLRQIGLAMNQYAQDYRFYPTLDFNAYTNPTNTCSPWADKVFPYIKSEKVFECPSNPDGTYRSDCPPSDDSDPDHILRFDGSYDLNIRNASRVRNPQTGKFSGSYPLRDRMSPSQYTRPSSTILVLDGDGGYVSPGYQEPPAKDAQTLSDYDVNSPHEGGANVGFADGHVKWMSLDSLLKRSLWRLSGPE